ncbi:MAG: hypothetical protein OXK21_01075, partial [Chloroflexota bacterium]|nr:hypothetical protein [Chloroflexota bacterium]
MVEDQEHQEPRPYWFVGASWGGTADQTDRFLEEGTWRNGWENRFLETVKAMQPGDRIAIKYTATRKHNLPFDAGRRTVSVMGIKAVGTVTENLEDGRTVRVDWTPVSPPREWYFYTYRRTVWQVMPGAGTLGWASRALVDFTFHDRPQDYQRFLDHWYPSGTVQPWDAYVALARHYVDSGRLEREEISYKREVGALSAEARHAVLSGAGDWRDRLKAALFGTYNLMTHLQAYPLEGWIDAHPDEVQDALRELWAGDDRPLGKRIRVFSQRLPLDVLRGVGTRLNAISILLMGIDADAYPPFRITLLAKAYRRTGYPTPDADNDEAAVYEHALGFFDRFMEEAASRGVTLRHRLDAQSVAWAIDRDRVPPQPPLAPPMLSSLAHDLLVPQEFLEGIAALLDEKRQVIFQGPPGTGKTFVAQ